MPATPAFLASHLIGCSALWASGFLFIKLTGGAVEPLALAAVRGLVGAATLALWFLARRESLWPQGGEWRHWAVLGALNGWGPNILVAFAMTQITAALGSMIQAAGPLIVAVLSHALFADERLTPRRAFGVLVGFAGMAVLIGPAAVGSGVVSAAGALAMVAVAVSYALGNVYVRTIKVADPARLALGQQVFSGGTALLIALVVVGPTAFAGAPDHAAALIALGVLSTAMPIVLFMRLIRRAGPTRAAMVGYLQPVWTTLLALAFLGETIGLREVIGGAVVLVGVALVTAPALKARAPAAA